MAVINTNISALAAQGSLSNVQKKQQTAMERLSTGLRINSAADDAAGLAITNRMNSQIRGYAVAIRNANDGISMTQTAEGALGNIGDMLQRMRELAVQSANGSNSAENRQAIQAEVAQLKEQINQIAKTTNFNDIKLLDGSAGNIVLQTGVNQNETMKLKFDSAQSKDLGINPAATLTSIGATITQVGALAEGDLILNGVTVGPSVAASDSLSYQTTALDAAKSAIAKVAAINKVSGTSGVIATVNENTVYGYAGTMASTSTVTSGTISINGVSTSSISIAANASTSIARQTVVQAINNISGQTGVTAVDGGDDTHGVILKAADGRNITVNSSAAAMTGEITGLVKGSTAETYVGTYSLTSSTSSPITISSKVGGTLKNAGLSMGTYDVNMAQVSTFQRAGAATLSSLGGGDLQINGVSVGAAIDTDDNASYGLTNAAKKSSAIATAAAINKVASLTGVKATAAPNVLVGTTFSVGTIDTSSTTQTFTLNGIDISLNLNINTTRQNVADVINLKSGQTGVTATDNGSGLTYVAADGRNITMGLTVGGSVGTSQQIGLATANGDTVTMPLSGLATSLAFTSRVLLSSDKAFTLGSGSSGNSNFGTLGFTAGTFGGNINGLTVQAMDVSTTTGAQNAISTIDSAIKQVSLQQARAGAFQNRLGSVVSNLTESNQNMNASRSRILDTDYANETTNLAKSQIISQAATAMLAQANQSGQSVLALLK